MKRTILMMTALAALSGCAATAKMITGPDGSAHQLITCNAIEECYEKAREVCGGNYKIVNTNTVTSGDANGTSSSQRLLVKCEK